MNRQMTFCAVIVTYNKKLLLSQCLESLMKQSRALDAIFLIDNASSDGTPEMLTKKGYIKNFPVEINSDYFEKESMIESLFNQGIPFISCLSPCLKGCGSSVFGEA